MKTLKDYKKEYDSLIEKKNLKGEEALKTVKQDGYALQYVTEQTPEICIEAVKQNGYALQYVKNQTEAICIEAVKQNINALQYVNEACLPKNHILVIDGKEIELSEESYQNIRKQLL